MKKRNIIILTITIFILISTITSAQIINYDEELIQIESLINNNTCENTNNIFRITRLNYSTNDQEKTIKYIQKWNQETYNISKEIKKYSQTNTGLINKIISGENNLEINISNQTINWKYEINCSNTTNNQTNNETEINITQKENNTNQTNNNDLNITIEINQTNNNSKTNKTQKEIENENKIEEEINIKINKEIFLVGEKLEFLFENNTQSITYWIEDLFGNIEKEEYTTTNNNKKTFTFKEQEEKDKTYILFAKNQEGKEKQKIISVKSIINEEESSKIEIINPEFLENKISLTIKAYRGSTKKTTVYCKTETKNKKSSDELKFKINSQKEEIEIQTTLYSTSKWESKTIIFCEGLDEELEIEIKTPQKEEEEPEEIKEVTKTTQTIKQVEEEKKITEETKKTINTSIQKQENNKITGSVTFASKGSQKEKLTTIITITAVVSGLLGGLAIYGPKKLIDKFIKNERLVKNDKGQ